MKPHQLFQAAGAEMQREIVAYLQNEQRPAFRTAINQLAIARKLRPVFLQRKSKEQQAAWLADQLRLKSSDSLAEQVIQVWLLKGQTKMLAAFLDAIGVEHKDGEVSADLPDDIDTKKAKAAIDSLLKKFPAKHVAIYLHLFQTQKEGGWAGLAAAMTECDAIKLNAAS